MGWHIVWRDGVVCQDAAETAETAEQALGVLRRLLGGPRRHIYEALFAWPRPEVLLRHIRDTVVYECRQGTLIIERLAPSGDSLPEQAGYVI